jgi:hypothetical protein
MAAPPLPEVFGNYAIHGIEEVLAPAPVSWWPSTPGWAFVGVLTLILLCRVAWKRWRHWRRNRYRRRALAQLPGRNGEAQARLQATAAVLKATAVTAYPRREVAALSGAAWLSWLEANGAGFCESSRRLLARDQYLANPTVDPAALDQLTAEAADWIRSHAGVAS